MLEIIIAGLYILVILAVLVLILYLFERFVMPVGQPIKGIIIFIVAALLVIYAISGGFRV